MKTPPERRLSAYSLPGFHSGATVGAVVGGVYGRLERLGGRKDHSVTVADSQISRAKQRTVEFAQARLGLDAPPGSISAMQPGYGWQTISPSLPFALPVGLATEAGRYAAFHRSVRRRAVPPGSVGAVARGAGAPRTLPDAAGTPVSHPVSRWKSLALRRVQASLIPCL